MRLTVLGSGTLLPSRSRHSSAYLLEAAGRTFLLDCGSGTVHGFDRYGIDWTAIDGVVFSHYHTDHLGDLPALLFALKHGVRPPRTRPLPLLGPPGLRFRLRALARAFGESMEAPGFPLPVEELAKDGSRRFPGSGEQGEGEIDLAFHPTPHTESSVAHRWSAAGRTVAYTGDTGPVGSELASFLSGADVLVAETSLPDDMQKENHLTPGSVAELARAATPRLLVTTHVYPPLEPDEVPRLVAEAGYGGRVEAAADGLVVEVGAEITVSRPNRS